MDTVRDFSVPYQVVNSRGRVLLQVTGADCAGVDEHGCIDILYTYKGDGIGGYTDIVNLGRTVQTIIMDSPSAHVIGSLPNPTIRKA